MLRPEFGIGVLRLSMAVRRSPKKSEQPDIELYARMLSAMGTEPRLRIMRLLLAAHPRGMIVMDIQVELGIPASTLSHHLEKLRHAGLVRVEREHCCLWYSANGEVLGKLLSFLYNQCCLADGGVQLNRTLRHSNPAPCC